MTQTNATTAPASPVATPAPRETDASSFPNDRRKRNIPVATDRRRAANAAAKRAASERRRLIDPATCERDYTNDESEFMKAMDRYKRDNRRPFPTWSEVLEVLRALGYRKVAEPSEMPGEKRAEQLAAAAAALAASKV